MMNFLSFSDEFLKLSAVTREEAEGALKRLKTLEETKPTAGQVARGALAGSAAGTTAALASNLLSGNLAKGVREAWKAPTIAGKVGKMGLSALRTAGGAAGGSAAFGATLPTVRGHLDRQAEIAKLKEYLGHTDEASIPSALHHKLTKVVGV